MSLIFEDFFGNTDVACVLFADTDTNFPIVHLYENFVSLKKKTWVLGMVGKKILEKVGKF
jgi:hypothetical protein